MKQPLIMLHGFGCDSRIFASIGTQLSKNYDVSMVDLPGHGQTKEQFRDFSFSAYTILHALKEYLKEPYHLLGWSMGGQIALEMFKQDPKLIKSLILISSTPRFVESNDFKIGMNKAVFSKFKKGIKNDPAPTMDDFYKLIFTDNEGSDKYISDIKLQTPNQTTLQACMDSFESKDLRNVLPKINIPTLIIMGNQDKIIDPKASMYMSQEIKDSLIRVFEGSGHAPHLTKEKEVIDELSKFLG